MRFEELTAEQVDALVDTREAVTDIAFPPQGLQPYHSWLIRTLHRLAACSVGAFRVDRSGDGGTHVAIAPGRASIDDVVLVYEGETVDLGSFNNSTARLWLADDEGAAVVEVGGDWPTGAHLKLAEVVLSAGVVEAVVDRRLETIFKV